MVHMADNPPLKFRNKEEAEYFFRARRLDIIDAAVRLLVPWGSLVAIAFWVHSDVVALAGRRTLAHIGLSFIGDIRISDAVAYIFGAAGTGYGIAERRLRQKNITRLAEENRTLEKKVDAFRSSSNLTRRGTTRPEDKK
jgi:hypothetical protein